MSDLDKVVGAVEEINKGFEAFKEANEANEAKRDVVLEGKLAAINESIDANQKIADDAALAAKRASRIVSDDHGGLIDLDQKAQDFAATIAARSGRQAPEFSADDLSSYGGLMGAYLRRGKEEMSPAEVKALSVGSDPNGGYTVHPDMSGQVSKRIYETSAMRAYASIQVISTDSLEGMYDNDEAASGWVAETGSRTETDTPVFGAWSIPVHELYAAPRATQKMLDDSSINVESWLASKVADKFARDEATAFTTGNGVGRPRGFLDYADFTTAGTSQLDAIEQFDTGVNADFAVAPNAGDALLDALYGLKWEYQINASWFMNRSVLGAFRKEKDSDGHYIWSPSAMAGQPSTIFGRPVASFEDMPALATGSLSIAVGDMRKAYQIVDRAGIRTLRDPYSNKPYVEFYSTKRVGGSVIDFDALKLVAFQS